MKRINAVIYISFFLSGTASLIYEILCSKNLSLIFGSTAYAYTLVIAIFMAGLALGGYLLGKLVDNVKDKLIFYALMEIGIALFCFFSPFLFKLSRTIYLTAVKNFPAGGIELFALKFLIGIIIMLPPTILMGGTLPVLSKLMTRFFSVRGKTVARLYWINSAGAVTGTLLAGFYLIRHFGLTSSILIAASINLISGLMIIALKLLFKKHTAGLDSKKEEAALREETALPDRIIRLSLIAIFISGFAAMVYELSWIRLLSIILGSSTYSFSLVVAAFITGITIGSFLISRFMPGSKYAFLLFGLCELLIALSLIVSIPFYDKVPFYFLTIAGRFSRKPETFYLYSLVKYLLSFSIMLLPTILLGMTFPLVSKVASVKPGSLGKSIGSVVAFNTTGNIAGVVICGLILIPGIGLRYTLEFGIALNLLIGVTVLLATKDILSKNRKIVLVLICCLVFSGYKLLIPEWNKSHFTIESFRSKKNIQHFRKILPDLLRRKEVIFHEDGLNDTVMVTKNHDRSFTIYLNGKPDASTTYLDNLVQVFLAQVPLIIKPRSKDVMVIGLGSGITCGSALLHPIESLDLIEISPSIVKANKHFAVFNHYALHDKRLKLHLEDARMYVQRTEKKYDLIISEPSNPWVGGQGVLFSREFFSDCLGRLNEDGLMTQWIHTTEMDDETFKIIVRTFCSVFPEVTLWTPGSSDIFLLGARERIKPDFEESEKRMAQKQIRAKLSWLYLRDLFTLLSFQLASGRNITSSIKKEGTLNTYYFPVLEYQAPLALYTGTHVKSFFINLNERRLPLSKGELLIKDYLKHHKIDYDNLLNASEYMKRTHYYNKNYLTSIVKRLYRDYPGDKKASSYYKYYQLDSIEEQVHELENLIFKENRIEHLDKYIKMLIQYHERFSSFLLPDTFTEVVSKLKLCIDLPGANKSEIYLLLGVLFFQNREYMNSIEYYKKAEKAFKHNEDIKTLYIPILTGLSLAYSRTGRNFEAAEYARRILTLDKKNSKAKELLELAENK